VFVSGIIKAGSTNKEKQASMEVYINSSIRFENIEIERTKDRFTTTSNTVNLKSRKPALQGAGLKIQLC
jgi:hypothetical protein